MSQFSEEVIQLIESATRLKRLADISYAKGEYRRSIDAYKLSIDALEPIKGSSLVELITIKTISGIVNAYLKLDMYSKAIETIDTALCIPSLPLDISMKEKLLQRKSIAVNASNHDNSYKKSTNVNGVGNSSAHEVPSSGSKLSWPPLIPQSLITEIIGNILQARGDPDTIIPSLIE